MRTTDLRVGGIQRRALGLIAAVLTLGLLGAGAMPLPATAANTGSISGHVTFVTGSFALPGNMSDVTVDLYDIDGDVITSVTPAPNGTFSFTNLADGAYALGYESSGGQYPYRFWPNGRDHEQAELIAVRNGGAVTGVAVQIISQAYAMILGNLHAIGNVYCFTIESTTSDFYDSHCFDNAFNPYSTLIYRGWSFLSGDTYILSGFEYDPVNGRYTDTLYWNNTGKDKRFRSNATPFAPGLWNTDYPSPGLDFAGLPWLGSNDSTDITVYTSVSPLYVGAKTTLTASFTGSTGTPGGIVEFYDDRGFIGDAALSGGSASVPYTVTHAGAWIMAVYYRGNAVYDIARWDVDFNFLPTVDAVSPGFGPQAGGTVVTLTGYALSGATSVTFDGVQGTELTVVSDTELTVTTPPGTSLGADVIVTGDAGVGVATVGADFAYTDSSVVSGDPAPLVDVSNFTQGKTRCYQVTGRAGVPVGATGVVLNVTASLPNAPGHVRVYPDYTNTGRSPAPAVSTVNFETNRDVANSTTIALPANGKVCAYSVGGTMSRFILDVTGFLVPGSGVVLTTPQKLIDTRSEAWYHVGPINGPVQPMTDYTVQVTGNAGVPEGAEAVMVNITVVDTRFPGHLRMWAAGEPMPNTSVVNYAPETKANSQIVDLSADGKLTFRSFSWVPTTMSPVQVLIDVTGYIEADSDFVATEPTTIVETRPAYTPVGLPGTPLNANSIYSVEITDSDLVPEDATAVVLNVTAVQPTNYGHIRVYPHTNEPGATPPPNTSNLNFIPGRDIPNMVVVQLPPGRNINFYTAYAGTGRTDLKVDLIGYITSDVD